VRAADRDARAVLEGGGREGASIAAPAHDTRGLSRRHPSIEVPHTHAAKVLAKP
jgi:hypothetical protein